MVRLAISDGITIAIKVIYDISLSVYIKIQRRSLFVSWLEKEYLLCTEIVYCSEQLSMGWQNCWSNAAT